MKTLNLRLPDEVHKALSAIAVADHRSYNATIITLIEAEQQRRGQNESVQRPR